MSSDNSFANARVGRPAHNRQSVEPAEIRGLSLDTTPRKSANGQRNPDPYNSSGSFDRTKNWARVGKR